MNARVFALLPVAVFAALGGFLLSGLFRENPDELDSVMIGREAPPLTLTELPGKPAFDPAVFADGEVKIVNFWASWCVPCRAEHPQLKDLAEDLPVYGINYKDQPGAALAFLEELGDPFAAIGADAGRTGIDWGLYGVPETFVVDGDGVVRLRFAGPITVQVMEETIRPVIEAAR
jgi:cytochrome c biogenesis protein CcmG/thiol:disulfide interchange protein DsbE